MAKAAKAPVVDRELILELTRLLEETGLTEIEIEQDGQRVRVARGATAPAAPDAGIGAARGAAGVEAALRATRTRWPSCSISISLRPVSLSSAVSSRIKSRSTIGDFGDFAIELYRLYFFALAPIMPAKAVMDRA